MWICFQKIRFYRLKFDGSETLVLGQCMVAYFVAKLILLERGFFLFEIGVQYYDLFIRTKKCYIPVPTYNIDDLTITDKEKEGVCKEPVNQG